MSDAANGSTGATPPQDGSGAGGPPPPFKVYLPGERTDENRGGEILAICVVLTILAIGITVLRVWVRRKFLSKLSLDDYSMVMATITLIAMTGTVFAQVFNGAGRHIEYIPPPVVIRGLHYNFASQPLCLIALGFARVSVSFFLIRLANSRKYKWILWFLIGLTVVLTVVGVFQTLFQCRPMAFVWDKSIPGGECVSTEYLVYSSYVSSSLSCASDFALASLPILMLRNVQMNSRVKLAVIGILSLGFFTVAAGVIKTVSLTKWGLQGDYLWDTGDITIWYTAEIAVAIIAGSIPCLKPLFKRILETTRRYGSSARTAPPGYVCSCGKPAPSYAQGSGSGSRGGGIVGSKQLSNNTIGSSGKKRHTKLADPYGAEDYGSFEMQVSPAGTNGYRPHTRDLEAAAGIGAVNANDSGNSNGNDSSRNKRMTRMVPTLTVNETTVTGGRDSDEEIILQGTDGIVRTTHISMSVDDVKEKSVKDMV
ncbi:hypothetical protein MCOR27_000405 [Pyricularia oryzae]|uniref:Rhodopsin domain-containing protein n=1 Tax=Pyricularia grisea TaxID=148305 RepID=A0ABQ8NAQ5_PYRGI|nr:hypothetical protein MCOR01_000117 [Pyricularia oryzae]KAI6294109.1 hypothetical protein MCOR33_008680 [Pyricularia grisea]KAI6267587.1 hypothetical protein MCOR26_009645 [Pyricularia oryzae]KAI6289080.1 hypothetical protein MCOR27_000405 [Pyricularia oryzae]KAI6317077.1 hypothetical protein MCOR30_009171 [Pyricularia oryzae]